MYNLIAWITRSPFRECLYCERIQDKSIMLHSFPCDWFCNVECRNHLFDEVATW